MNAILYNTNRQAKCVLVNANWASICVIYIYIQVESEFDLDYLSVRIKGV